MRKLRPDIVMQQIQNLKVLYPELADDEDGWLMTVESETDANEFLRQVERKRQEAAAMAGALASNIAEMEIRQQRFENREKAMRQLAFKVMQAADMTKVELPECTFSIRAIPPSVIITDESQLPDVACKFTRSPDKTKIKELLQTEPFHVAGATMSNGGSTISIRTK